MDKLKNMFHPGRAQDEETLYGSGQNTGKTGGLTGEGSHLASNTGNTSGLAGSQTTGTSGLGNTSSGVPSEASTDQDGRPIGSGATPGLAGQESHLGGATSGTSTGGQSNFARDAATTAAATTGGNTGFAHHGTTRPSNMPGSWDETPGESRNNSYLGSNPSAVPQSTSGGYPTQGTSELGSTTGSSSIPQDTNTSSGHHLGRDAAALGTAGAVGEGAHHHREDQSIGSTSTTSGYPGTTQDSRQTGSNITGGAGNPLRDDGQSGLGSAKVLGTTTSHSTRLPSGSGVPSSAAVTQNPHYSAGLPDRSVGSQQPSSTTGYGTQQPSSTTGYGSQPTDTTSSGHHLGRDAAVAGGAGALGGEALHHHHDQQNLRDQYSGSSSTQPGTGNEYAGTSREMPLSSNTGSSGINQSSQPTASNTGYGSQQPSSTTGYGSSQSGNTSSGHHYGRDAAALGTAGAVGEGIHHHREHEQATGPSGVTSGSHNYGSSSGPHSTDTANLLDPNIRGGASRTEDAYTHNPRHGGGAEAADKDHTPTVTGSKAGYGDASSSTQPTTGGTTSRTDPISTSKDHHYGRDAAVGAGSVGAAGLAGHEYEKHRGEGTAGAGTELGQNNSEGPAANTAGPHSKDWMNKLDPRVTANPTTAQSNPQDEYGLSGQKPSTEAGGYGGASSASTDKDHHYGRDAAIGAGGVGAAGVAGREYEKHRGENTSGLSSTTGTSQPTSSTYGTGSNASGYGSQQPSSTTGYGSHQSTSTTTSSSQQPSSTSGHHYGRDAAAAGGVGAAGYEAEKHLGKHNNPSQTGTSAPYASSGNTTAPRAHHNDMFGSSSNTTPNIENQHQTTGYQDPTASTQQSRDHHYGRDAAVAGGVGGAAYEAEHHKHDKDLTQFERDAKKQHKHDEKEAEKEAKEVKKEQKHEEAPKQKKGGLLGFLHRDKNKKYTKEEDEEFDRQEREHNSSHTGRDAALGTAGAGALGTGAYEAEKHHHGQTGTSTDKPLPHAPGNQGVGTGAGTQNALAGDNTTGQSGHHYGRDAALGTGAAGTAGYAAHEHNKHQGSTPLSDKPVGTDFGDKLHGAERNRGVPGSSGFPGEQGYGVGASTGTSGRGSNVHSEASTDQYGNPLDSGVPSNYASQGQGQSHLGRDAAIGAGAASAAGVGAHEHHKHDSGYQNTMSPIGQQFDNKNSSGLTGSQQQGQHHYGRDAAAAGGVAGAGALGEHEYRKHEGQQGTSGSNLTGNNQYDNSSAGYGQQQSGTTGSHHHGHHHGRDAAAVGGAGALGEHEYRKHDTTPGQQVGSGQQSGIGSNDQYEGAGYGQSGSGFTGSDDISDPRNDGRVGPNVVEGSDGRKRLHKDPPARHPAAQAASGYSGSEGGAHVPGNGSERQRLVQEGEQSIDKDSGVAYPGNQRNNY